MIVVVGSPIARPIGSGIVAGGLGAAIARRAAIAGAAVQVVGRVGEDPAGDLVLLDLAAAGVGHVAVLREPGRPTPAAAPLPGGSPSPDGPALGEALAEDLASTDGDAAAGRDGAIDEPVGLTVDAGDVELALRYVPDYRVLVLAADVDAEVLRAVVDATAWSGAHLIALVADDGMAAMLPSDATVLARPGTDPDDEFAAMVAAYAVALDEGSAPGDAFATAKRAGGWAAVAD